MLRAASSGPFSLAFRKAHMSPHASLARPDLRVQSWLSVAVLVFAGLLGGGQGGLGDTLVQLLALALLGWMAWAAGRARLHWQGPGWARWLPLLALVPVAIQLLPVPASLWAASPVRAELGAQLQLAGVVHARALSLNPGATEHALWSLLPACALFVSVLALTPSWQRRLLGVIVGIALCSFVFGLLQLSDGEASALRFYYPTNPNSAVGFFANSNHLASLFVLSLPLVLVAAGWAVSERLAGRELSLAWPLAATVAIVLLILGIALSKSRAGLLLGMVALLGSLPIVLALRRQRGTRRLLAVVLGLAMVVTVQFALFGILQRMQADPLDDGRWHIAEVTGEAARAHAPLGSGFGTFRQAYQPFELRSTPQSEIVNHAHDDYLEAWLEGGWPAVGAMLVAALAWLALGLQLWRRGPAPGERGHSQRLLARTAYLAASLPLLHSALDYPLRTTAMMSVFAVLAATAFAGWPRPVGAASAATNRIGAG